MRKFVVAAWERQRRRERELRTVEADTAEHAVVAVAVTRQADCQSSDGEVVYEAWPEDDPGSNLRMILGRPRRQLRT
ncbi:MAG: hypothetical protein JST31_07210 [Actinobacteria bacterium]|nr:hypothetical protein [Actinomycetota bacterium]